MSREAADTSGGPGSGRAVALRGFSVVAVGYGVEAAGLVAFLTINGSSVSELASIVTVALIAIGLLLTPAALLLLRRGFDKTQAKARNGLALQGFGLVVLLLGVVLGVGLSSLFGYTIGAVLLVASATSALLGVILLRKGYASKGANPSAVDYLVVGTALVFSGVGLIMASNIAFYYMISQVANTVYVDAGAAVSACGCVVAAFSFFTLRGKREPGLSKA
jgi:hypothetical protein